MSPPRRFSFAAASFSVATGFNSIVAPQVRPLRSRQPSLGRGPYASIMKTSGASRIRLSSTSSDEVLPGYFWAFPLENGCANVGIGMLHESIKGKNVNLKDALRQVTSRPPFADRFADARPLEKTSWLELAGRQYSPNLPR